MRGGRAAGRDVWVRVEDGRGGDGKLVLLARPGLSNAVGGNAVGGRGNVGSSCPPRPIRHSPGRCLKYAIDVICAVSSLPLARAIAITRQNCFE